TPFQVSQDVNSDIIVYESDSAGNPQGTSYSTGGPSPVTTYSGGPWGGAGPNWVSANWTQAPFGQYIAVVIKCQYRPITYKLLLMPSSFTLQFQSIMQSEANY